MQPDWAKACCLQAVAHMLLGSWGDIRPGCQFAYSLPNLAACGYASYYYPFLFGPFYLQDNWNVPCCVDNKVSVSFGQKSQKKLVFRIPTCLLFSISHVATCLCNTIVHTASASAYWLEHPWDWIMVFFLYIYIFVHCYTSTDWICDYCWYLFSSIWILKEGYVIKEGPVVMKISNSQASHLTYDQHVLVTVEWWVLLIMLIS